MSTFVYTNHRGQRKAPGTLNTRKPKSDAGCIKTEGVVPRRSIPAITRHLGGHLPDTATHAIAVAPCPQLSTSEPLCSFSITGTVLAQTQRARTQGQGGTEQRERGSSRGHGTNAGPETPTPGRHLRNRQEHALHWPVLGPSPELLPACRPE